MSLVYDDNDVVSLALCSWKESRGDGIGACYAQMHVVVNRVGQPGFGKTLHDCIYGKNQFTSMSVPSDPEFNLEPDPSDSVYPTCLIDAPNVLNGDSDPTGGALYYANLKTATSGWFYDNIVNRPDIHPVTVIIGHHTFFK